MSKHTGLPALTRVHGALQPVWAAMDGELAAYTWPAGSPFDAAVPGADSAMVGAPAPSVTSDSWTATAGGDWSTAADWSTHAVPGASTSATIAAAGTYTVTITTPDTAASLLLNNANATVVDTGTLSIGTSLTITAGTFALESGGEIVGGTISVGSAGTLAVDGGTLSGVTYQGTLNLSAESAALTVVNGLTLSSGVINLTGFAAALFLDDTQTLNNLTIDIGNNTDESYLYFEEDTGSAATLTLGSKVNITQAGAYAYFYTDEQNAGNKFINQGTITAGISGGDFYIYAIYAGDTFINQGTLTASNSDTLSIDAASFTNTGSLSVSGDAVLELAANVTTGGLGHFSTATGGVLELGGIVTNTGATLTLGSAAQLTLISGGEIVGGTVIDTGGNLLTEGGTLSGVTYQGTLNLSAESASVTVVNGLTLSSGVINLTGAYADLYLDDTQTLNNLTIDIGSDAGYSSLYFEEDTGSAATLTLGSKVNITQAGTYAYFYTDYEGAGNKFINQGTITAGISGGDFYIYAPNAGDTFINQGTLIASNGDTLYIDAASFTNTGSLSVSGDAVLELAANVTTGGLGHFSTATGGVLELGGIVTNTGATLTVGSTSQLALISGGEIVGGTVIDTGGNLLTEGGTLSGVTYQGTLNLSAESAALTVVNGLTLSSGVINLTGAYADLYLDDTQTLNNLTIDIGSDAGYSSLYFEEDTGSAATLTLGSKVNITQAGTYAYFYTDYEGVGNKFINQGTITAGISGGDFYIYAQIAGDTFINQGTLIASNSDTLYIDAASFTNTGSLSVSGDAVLELAANVTTGGLGHFSTATGGVLELDGIVTNTGATLTVGSTSQLALISGGEIVGGTIIDTGGNLLTEGGTLSGVTYQGTLNLSAESAALTVVNGLTLSSGIIALTGQSAFLYFDDTQTVNNLTIDIGNNTDESYLYFEGDTGSAATLTLGSKVNITQTGTYAYFATDANGIGTTVINQGTITAGVNGATFYVDGPYTGDKFTNLGTLLASNGGTLDLSQGAGVLTNIANGTLTAGTFEANAGSILQLTNNETITTDAATIILSGANSVIESLNGTSGTQVTIDQKLVNIATTGTLELLAGRSFSASAAFTDDGHLQLGGGKFTATTLTLATGATVTGFGTLAAAVTDHGTLAASGGTLTVTGAVSSLASGTLTGAALSASAASTLSVTGTAITLDAGDIILAGAGSAILVGGTAIDSTLATIAATGTLAVQTGRSFTATANTGKFTDDGILSLAGGKFASTSLTVATAAQISGYGTVTSAIANAGTINAAAGTLALAGTLTGAGVFSAAAGAVLDITTAGTLDGKLTGAGEIELAAATTLTTGASLTVATLLDTANLTLGAGYSLTNAAADTFALNAATGTITLGGATGDSFTNAGTLTAGGAGTADIATAFVNSGAVSVSAGTLAFLGAVTNTGTIDAATGLLSITATVAGTGTLEVGTAGTLSLLLGAASGQTADFLGGTGLLELTKPLDFAGTIAGFAGSETIELTGSTETTFTYSGGTLTIVDGTTKIAALHFSGSYTQADFALTNSGGDVLIKFV